MSLSSLPCTFIKGFHDEELCGKMEYRYLGSTGLRVSKISLGAAALCSIYGDLDLEEGIATVHKALKAGINYIDTAPYYGQGRSEEVLGLALKTVPRSAYYIATKVGRYGSSYENMFDYSAEKTRESVRKSLQLLGLDYVDVIQIHDVEFAKDLNVVINECLPELEKIVRDGQARFIGLTGYPLKTLKECTQLGNGKFDTVLSYARNTLCDDSLKSYIHYFQKENVGVICAAAHAVGLLTNGGPQPWHPCSDEQKQLCRKAANICKEADIELGKLAMYYCMQLDGPATFLVGMKTRQVLDVNLDALYNGLTQKEQEVLQLLKEIVFTKPINWEGNELERYWAAMNNKKEKN